MGIKCNIFKNDFGEVDYTLDQNGNKSKLFNDASKVFSKEKALEVWALAYTDKFKEVYDRIGEPTLNEVVMFMEANKERLPLEQQEVTDFRLSMVGTTFTDSYELARQLKSAFLPTPTKKSLKSLGMYSDSEIKNILNSTYLQNKIVDNAFRLSNADIIYNDIEVDERIVSVDNTVTDILGKAKNNNPLEEESVLINEVGGIKDEQEFKDKLITDFPQVDNTAKQVAPKPVKEVNKSTAELVTKYLQEKGVDISVLPEVEMNKLANSFGFNNFNAMIEAWHGGANLFDKFSWDKVGTGVKAMRSGAGIYFTKKEDRAKGYARQLSDKTTFTIGDEVVKEGGMFTGERYSIIEDIYNKVNGSRISFAKELLKLSDSEKNKGREERIRYLESAIKNNRLTQEQVEDGDYDLPMYVNIYFNNSFDYRQLAKKVLKSGVEKNQYPSYLYSVVIQESCNWLDFKKPVDGELYDKILIQAEKENSPYLEKIKQ